MTGRIFISVIACGNGGLSARGIARNGGDGSHYRIALTSPVSANVNICNSSGIRPVPVIPFANCFKDAHQMRVALFGGTGFVGRYLVDALVAAGHEPALLVRPGSEEKVTSADHCRLTSGHLGERAAIDATLEGCDAIIFAVGILREQRGKGITFESLQHDAVVDICAAAREQGISRFLLMSANGVRPHGTPYQDTKFRAEAHVRAAGFAATIVRPSVIFGDPRGAMEIATQLFRDLIRPPLPAIGFHTGWRPTAGPVMMSPVHARDVADTFVYCLENPDTAGQVLTLGGPEALSWVDMLRRVAAATGRRKWIVPVPVRVMFAVSALFDWLPFFPVTRDQLRMLAEGNTADPARLQTLLGRPAIAFTPENLSYLADAA
jgi:NADH dehydrogenase